MAEKKLKKLPVVLILAAIALLVLVLSIVIVLIPELSHNKTYPGEELYGERGNQLLVTHQGTDCASCHESAIHYSEGNDFCFTCHDSDLSGIQQATASYTINPHVFFHGEEDCSSCHKVHDVSVLTCAGCHEEMADALPDSGWEVPDKIM